VDHPVGDLSQHNRRIGAQCSVLPAAHRNSPATPPPKGRARTKRPGHAGFPSRHFPFFPVATDIDLHHAALRHDAHREMRRHGPPCRREAKTRLQMKSREAISVCSWLLTGLILGAGATDDGMSYSASR
jgi:hypothetical protein